MLSVERCKIYGGRGGAGVDAAVTAERNTSFLTGRAYRSTVDGRVKTQTSTLSDAGRTFMVTKKGAVWFVVLNYASAIVSISGLMAGIELLRGYDDTRNVLMSEILGVVIGMLALVAIVNILRRRDPMSGAIGERLKTADLAGFRRFAEDELLKPLESLITPGAVNSVTFGRIREAMFSLLFTVSTLIISVVIAVAVALGWHLTVPLAGVIVFVGGYIFAVSLAGRFVRTLRIFTPEMATLREVHAAYAEAVRELELLRADLRRDGVQDIDSITLRKRERLLKAYLMAVKDVTQHDGASRQVLLVNQFADIVLRSPTAQTANRR